MKLNTVLTYAGTILLSATLATGAVSYYFLESYIPSVERYIDADPHYIQYAPDKEYVYYNDVLEKTFLGNLYLWGDLYSYKRQKGYDMLAELAHEGYSPAAVDLHNYHLRKLNVELWGKDDTDEYKSHLAEAYKWAKLAAEQGDGRQLGLMIVGRKLEDHKNLEEDLKLMKKLATDAPYRRLANIMYGYASKNRNKEDADYYNDLISQIWVERREAACKVITPQRWN